MVVEIGSEIRIKNASKELNVWAQENLIIPNPQYRERERRGLWVGNTPKYLWLYRVDSSDLIVPTGVGKQVRQFLSERDQISVQLADNDILEYKGNIPLYDYQKTAVEAMRRTSCGILQSPCGSGKTQMGIALAAVLKRKVLWVTHTQDLLTQSFARAEQYFPAETLGTITDGKVRLGSHMTFATVQTLSKLDLTQYRDAWDVVIVDECHRLAGSPTQVTMFYKVMNSLAARYKYGLSATVHRSDGMIKSTFAVLGPVVYQVPDEAVADKIMKVRICRRDTGLAINRSCLDTDGTLVYNELLSYLGESRERNELIVKDLISQAGHSCLVLASRLEQLRNIRNMLPEELREVSAMIDGSMTSKRGKAEREAAIEDMRTGRKRILFASFGLAKEGLDIPRLDRLYLVSPQKDYAVVTQSIGRIARKADGKTDAVCYDYVDDIQFCENQFKRRKTHYRKAGCIL
ncbi:ATP-dependent helicase [Clostridium sp. AF27-2AA]|jgi:superfamily II DNA or RNA helicase|uniref:DEAD/DEAH box helicase n=1 Tax=Clostridium sp. AF27-2AA TaxID=2292206 RepID=UPI000E46E54E|nr:DEAD/DEAH box helicase [Clostridium sp. AF27-2AA]RHQ34223.1 ATP-dependent helicase [Clostridium sp. AF27-2AA]DAL31440.1 MAG TPA_asm: DNA helicase [Caudoviricetes sp.]